jgi:hypothetical protein
LNAQILHHSSGFIAAAYLPMLCSNYPTPNRTHTPRRFKAMTTEQIKAILLGTEETLRMIASLPEYQELQNHDHFDTNNDLTLGDAIQAVSEVYEAIVSVQYQQEIDAQKADLEAQSQLNKNWR